MDLVAEGFEAGESLPRGVPLRRVEEDRQSRVGDGLLERGEFARGVTAGGFAEVAGIFLHDARRGLRVAEVEERMSMLTEPVKHAVAHFVFSNGAFAPWRHPAIAAAEHAHETRPAFIDDLEANTDHVRIGGHTPAQVHIHKMNAPRQQLLAQPREDKAHQPVPLGLHVAEGRGDEDADGFPRVHGFNDWEVGVSQREVYGGMGACASRSW